MIVFFYLGAILRNIFTHWVVWVAAGLALFYRILSWYGLPPQPVERRLPLLMLAGIIVGLVGASGFCGDNFKGNMRWQFLSGGFGTLMFLRANGGGITGGLWVFLAFATGYNTLMLLSVVLREVTEAYSSRRMYNRLCPYCNRCGYTTVVRYGVCQCPNCSKVFLKREDYSTV